VASSAIPKRLDRANLPPALKALRTRRDLSLTELAERSG
jgi:hypothetical protein